MTPTREIYWNVPYHNLLYILFIITILAFAYGISIHYRRWRLGKRNPFSTSRDAGRLNPTARGEAGLQTISRETDGKGKDAESYNVLKRLWFVLLYVFAHRGVIRQLFPGLTHLVLFWGFVALFVGTNIVALEANFPVKILYGRFYLWFSIILDVFGLLSILAVSVFAFRRYVIRPDRLNSTLDDAISLSILFIVLVTGFIVEGLRININEPPAWASWSPGGLLFSNIFSALCGDNPYAIIRLHRILWWLHLVLCFGLIAYIPYSRLFHIFTSPINIFLRPLSLKRALDPIDIEASETFGAERVEDFTIKELFDVDACMYCGRCQASCPAYLSDKPLSPKKINIDLMHHLEEKMPFSLGKGSQQKGKAGGRTLIGEVILKDEIWSCTACGACERACPVFMGFIGKIVEMRRNMVLMQGRCDSKLINFFRNLEVNFNPYGFSNATRADWATGLGIKRLAVDSNIDVLLWVGCAGSFDDRSKKATIVLANILKKAGVNFGILGEEERCTGEAARRVGNEYLFQTLARENIKTLNKYNIKKIITTCPHCLNTLKHEYPQFGGHYEVLHHTEEILNLINKGRLRPHAGLNEVVTYHDPCYLGRFNGIYNAPRNIINSATGSRLIELPRNRQNSFCCGGGGGHMWMEMNLGRKINVIRVEEALSINPSVIATACPFCMKMLDDGVKLLGKETSLKTLDIAELMERCV